jgi:hypothetical protein
MKAIIFTALALAFATAAAQAPNPPRPPKPVRGQGCIQTDTKARCLLVKDIRTGILYDLLIRGVQPKLGSGIDFTGIPHKGATYCMQGIALDVSSWREDDSLKCVPVRTPRL